MKSWMEREYVCLSPPLDKGDTRKPTSIPTPQNPYHYLYLTYTTVFFITKLTLLNSINLLIMLEKSYLSHMGERETKLGFFVNVKVSY